MTSISPPVYNGRYELSRQIARGGMAEVYLAHDQLLDRPVALKVLFPELSVDRSFVERFRREAQAAANLSHPNIVSVYDWGQAEGTYFIVMEHVDGRPLSALIRDEAPILPDKAAAIGADVASALGFAHSHGVVHRDVKPGNVLLTNEGQVKVTDFGIARAANATENLTQTGAVMGTATYFSPEQAQGLPVDGRSDVYSLGVVLYEMVTGRPPFSGDNPVSVAYKHVRETPPPPRQLNPTVPAAFEAIILQAIAKSADQRYASASDLRADLVRYQQGQAVLANPATTLVAADQTRVDGTRMDRTQALTKAGGPKKKGLRTRTYVIMLLVLLALLGLVVYFLGRNLGFFNSGGAADQVPVPSVQGQLLPQAMTSLTRLGLRTSVVRESNPAPANTVFSQSPAPPARVDKGSTVTLDVSTGPGTVSVPLVRDQPQGVAQANLSAVGLQSQVVTETVTNPAEGGLVIGQVPAPGTQVAKGSTVTLTVGSYTPPATTTAPTTTTPPTTTRPPPTSSPTSTTTTTTTAPAGGPSANPRGNGNGPGNGNPGQ